MRLLPLIAGLAGLWCMLGLALAQRRARRFGARRLFAPAAGHAAAGARYAFTKGMAPQAKESVRMNPLSYLAGVLYHGGLFAAFLRLGLTLANLPRPGILAVAALPGALGGLALLGKRLFKPTLRGLSNPDDYLSNLLATAFAVLAGASLRWPGLEGLWLAEGAALLIYVPLGKIRHCLFFFTTRYHSGAFFGRRGVFPPGASRA
jgi:hypothetical protein